MLIIGEYIIYLQTYMIIGIITAVLFSIYFIYVDLVNGISIITMIKIITEALILGLSWIISIPITVISNIIITIIYLYYSKIESEEEE